MSFTCGAQTVSEATFAVDDVLRGIEVLGEHKTLVCLRGTDRNTHLTFLKLINCGGSREFPVSVTVKYTCRVSTQCNTMA